MSDAINRLFARFTALYGDPQTADIATFLAEYRAALGGWSDEVLVETGNATAKAHVYRSWPTIGELTERAKAAAAKIDRNRPAMEITFDLPRRGGPDINLQTKFDLAAEWRRQVAKSHGSVDAWLNAHRRTIKYFWDDKK